MAYQQRGLNEQQEQFHSLAIRDTRSMGMRVADFLRDPKTAAMALLITVVGSYLLYSFADLFLLVGLGIFLYCYYQKSRLPFRLPQRSKLKDYNDPLPGSNKPRNARGIYYFGNDRLSKQELWFANEDMRTHALIFGSTGSGKTEALVSIAYNALVQASGFIYVDGKGDNSLFAKLFSMVRSMGREDDMLLINFMTGARDIIGPQDRRLSNTLNPFANGSSSMLSQLITGLMPSSSNSSDGDMWKGRAIGFIEALMRVLVTMRDMGYVLLDSNTIRNYFHLEKLEAMVIDKLFLRENDEAVSLDNLPPSVLEPIVNYLLTLPGYNKERKGKQVSQVLEQHGYITMQLTRVFTSLADTYGHIMRTDLAEVDLKDVVLNRRILCVLLPALEKSPDELSNLGKIIIASLKAMMAAGLGDGVEGDLKSIIESKPTNSRTPYLCILDEYGYYAVQGFAVVPAQARSLGFSVVFAGQDLPAFQKASKEEAASIGANTNIKICMKLEDPTETWDFFMKSAGESYVTHVDSFQVNQGSIFGMYQDGRGARLEKRARIDLQDLKEQREGEAHIFFRSKIVRGKFFYASPKPVKEMRLNHLLKVGGPPDLEVKQMLQTFEKFELLAKRDNMIQSVSVDSTDEELKEVLTHFKDLASESDPIKRSMVAFSRHFKKHDFSDFFAEDVSEDEVDDHSTIFTTLHLNPLLESVVKTADLKAFCKPLINRSNFRDQIEYIERLGGKNSQQSMNTAIEVLDDLGEATYYPPKIKPLMSHAAFADRISKMADAILLKKQEAESK